MATKRMEAQAGQGEILNRDPENPMTQAFEGGDLDQKPQSNDDKIVAWVTGRTDAWKTHRDSNHKENWDTYERLWRGIYSPGEAQRGSERSKIISPALSEAVENGAAEIEEAVFGRGDFFDIRPEIHDKGPLIAAVQKNESMFKEELGQTKFRASSSEIALNGAIYGTGIGEIVVESRTQRDVFPQQDPLTGRIAPSIAEREKKSAVLRSVNPRNFIIDPAARCVDDALGVAIEEDVSSHLIKEGIDSGEYNKVDLESTSGDSQLKPDPQVESPWSQDVVTVLRYYGKVPRHLIFPEGETEELFDDEKSESDQPHEAEMVEAVVFIVNNSKLLKAEETRDMMKDRPVVAFRWDYVPGRFWGRGICEKGATPQKLLDAELRSRVDALAYVSAPMMAMDASRLPRGFKLEIYPGKNVLLAGNPSEILKPFKFGELDQNSGPQVQMLDQMVQRATGSIDAGAMAQAAAGGQARSGAVSMALSGVVKRNKRTLMAYVDEFLVPCLRKMLWRNMQYNSKEYVPFNFSFNLSSTMGIMQREYETQSMAAMLQSMSPGSSEHLMLTMGIVQNSGMANRDAVLQTLGMKLKMAMQTEQAQMQAAMNPQPEQPPVDPMQQQLQQMQMQLAMEKIKADILETQARTRKLMAEARSEMMEPEFRAREVMLKGIYQTPEEKLQSEFDRRVKLAEGMMKIEKERTARMKAENERADILSNERIARIQAGASLAQKSMEQRPEPQQPPADPMMTMIDKGIAAEEARTDRMRAENERLELVKPEPKETSRGK